MCQNVIVWVRWKYEVASKILYSWINSKMFFYGSAKLSFELDSAYDDNSQWWEIYFTIFPKYVMKYIW